MLWSEDITKQTAGSDFCWHLMLTHVIHCHHTVVMSIWARAHTHPHTHKRMSWTRCTSPAKKTGVSIWTPWWEIKDTESTKLALGSQNQAIQLSDAAHGFMGHDRLTRDCSLNLMFAELGQRQIVLILDQYNNIRLFISQEPLMCFHSKAMSCVIPGTVQVI